MAVMPDASATAARAFRTTPHVASTLVDGDGERERTDDRRAGHPGQPGVTERERRGGRDEQRQRRSRSQPRPDRDAMQAITTAVILDEGAHVEPEPRAIGDRQVAVLPPPAVELDLPHRPLLAQTVRCRPQEVGNVNPPLAPVRASPPARTATAEAHRRSALPPHRPASQSGCAPLGGESWAA